MSDGDGTTSACAENTMIWIPPWLNAGNYLRVRGEYCLPGMIRNSNMELPPRARRIQMVAGVKPTDCGTTSACAENTPHVRQLRYHDWNYLRVRGEYVFYSPKILGV